MSLSQILLYLFRCHFCGKFVIDCDDSAFLMSWYTVGGKNGSEYSAVDTACSAILLLLLYSLMWSRSLGLQTKTSPLGSFLLHGLSILSVILQPRNPTLPGWPSFVDVAVLEWRSIVIITHTASFIFVLCIATSIPRVLPRAWAASFG